MAEMDVVARFRADITDIKSKMDTISRGLGNLDGTAVRTNKGMGALGKGVAVAGIAFGAATAAVGALGGGLALLARQGQESLAVQRTTEQIIKSTGAAAGVTAQQVNTLADALSRKTGIDDEAIQTGANLILTFKNVKNAGEGTDAIFNRATAAALDLSKAGFGSVDSASKSLGKALNDPIKGITALSRAGVTFTQGQKDQIKALMESGDVLAAQKIILAEVESQVGGVAEATRSPIEAIQTMLGNLVEEVGKTLIPMFNKIADALGPILERLAPPLAQVVDMLGGVLVTALEALTPLFQPLADAMTSMAEIVGGVLTTVLQALVPVITPLLGLIANLANILGPVIQSVLSALMPLVTGLGDVITALAPAFLALVSAIAPVVEILAGTIGQVLAAIVPLIVELANVLGGFLTQALAALAPYWQQLANLIGALVSAVLPPLIQIVMALLDALIPILEPVAELIGLFAELATPILQLVAALAPLFTLTAQLVAAVLAPLLKIVGQIIGAMVRWLNDAIKPLMPAFKEGMKVITQFAATAVRAAAQIIRQFGKMVDFLISDVFGTIVDGAASAFGWIPVVGDGIKEAQASFAEFASSTVSNIEGVASQLDGVASQLDTMAQGYTVPVTVQYSAVYDESMKMSMKPGAITPPAPKPPLTPYTGGGNGGGGGGGEKDKALEKAIDAFQERADKLQDSLTSAADAYKTIGQAAVQKFGEPSEILRAFGKEGDVGSVIGLYDQLDSALRDYYGNLAKAPGLSKKQTKLIREEGKAQRAALETAAREQVALMRRRAEIQAAMQKAEEDYRKQQDAINSRYDALDKSAEASISAIEKRYDTLIPQLEKALNNANEAFERENNILQDLIKQRDSFLGQIASGTRKFVNDFSNLGSGANIRMTLEDRLKQVREFAANIRALVARGLDPTLVQEFVSQGVSGAGDAVKALASASASDLAAINAVQVGLANEAASLQDYAAAQWFDAGIAQQEAIVAPLRTAADQAKAALDMANAARETELAAARAHAAQLKADRQAELVQAEADYRAQQEKLQAQFNEIELSITQNADNLQAKFALLQTTLPADLRKTGKAAIAGLMKGIEDKEPELIAKAKSIGKAVKDALEDALKIASPSRVTEKIGMQVAQGLADGMGRGEALVSRSAGDLGIGAVPSTMTGSSGGSSVVVNNRFEIRVESLAGDKRQIGREVVEAIKAFERSSGPVYQPASV